MYTTETRTKKRKRFEVSVRPGRLRIWYPQSSHRWYWVARLEALGWEDANVPVKITDTKTGEILWVTEGDDV